mmetsp:Transcript_21802/g.64280  ORF Transcript_21802/g.64280 Transcript_21802/m.64280 type:complete len:196 (-) Transcript_21802:3755-4342(-)
MVARLNVEQGEQIDSGRQEYTGKELKESAFVHKHMHTMTLSCAPLLLQVLLAVSSLKETHATRLIPSLDHPKTYQKGDLIPLKINNLSSTRNLFPKDVYSLAFCRPDGGPVADDQNIGQRLAGDYIQNAPYQIRMKEDTFCSQLCVKGRPMCSFYTVLPPVLLSFITLSALLFCRLVACFLETRHFSNGIFAWYF